MKRALPVALILALFASVGLCQKTPDLDKKELAMLKGLETEQAKAKAVFTKNPGDANAKKKYVAVTMKLADAQLVSPALSSKQKYPMALRNYRIAYKLDPKNKDAKGNIDMIEGIYKSMGRPIPPN